MVIYAGNLAPFLMHLRIILLWSSMLIAGWLREIHHLKYSYESDIIWLWNIETWKKRTVAYKNETPRHNSWTPNSTQSLADRWSPVIQKLDCDTLGRPAFECFAGSQPVGFCSPRGDPSGWPGWSQPDPEIATSTFLHWMWCQTQFPRHRSAHCVRNRIITRKNKRHDQN